MSVSDTRNVVSGSLTITQSTYYKTYRIPVTPTDSNLDYMGEAVQIASATYIPTVVGSNGSAVTAVIRKCTAATAPASGTSLHASGSFNLKGTINTAQSATLAASTATLQFAAGDRLALDVTGTTTAATGILVVGYTKL